MTEITIEKVITEAVLERKRKQILDNKEDIVWACGSLEKMLEEKNREGIEFCVEKIIASAKEIREIVKSIEVLCEESD